MLEESSVFLDHTTIYRSVVRFTPVLGAAARSRRDAVGGRWRMDETHIKVGGKDCYLYRAVDREDATVDLLVTARRDRSTARRFLLKAIGQAGCPTLINIDKIGANTAATADFNAARGKQIEVR